MNTHTLTLGSLFDGIGGFPYAAALLGIQPLWASEIMPQAVSVTRRHFPEMLHVGDITKLDGATLPPVDIITFGSPCQDLSVAGRRAGLAGERSGLFTEAVRIIYEMRRATNGKYPRYALWENVPGALSSAGGLDFRAVLAALTKTEIPVPASGKWANAGMVRGSGADLAWRVLDAQHFGVPQRRKRIFALADFGGERAAEILFVEQGVRRNTAPCAASRQGAAAAAEDCARAAVPRGVTAFAANQRDEVRDLGEHSGALQANPGMKQQTFIAERSCMNPWDTQQSRVFTAHGTSPTLASADGGGGRSPGGLVFAPTAAFLGGAAPTAGGIGYSETVSPTLKAGGSGHPAPCVCEPSLARTLTARGDSSPCADRGQNVIAYGISSINNCTMKSGNPKSGVYEAKSSRTLDTNGGTPCCNQGGMAVVCRKAHPEVAGTLCASGAGLSRTGGMASEPDLCVAYALQGNMIGRSDASGPQGSGVSENLSFTLTSADTHAVTSGYIVRRLTPTECERLQGFPDGWTRYGHDGKEISDTRRYQILGNSVAIPCVAYIFGNLLARQNAENTADTQEAA
ncbi:MAG: DNA cytosine methyltransferase [Oscillospiraceae bacterium]|nr:DNA cytosine methyltransferase [Oscillospiraceae bacterium]